MEKDTKQTVNQEQRNAQPPPETENDDAKQAADEAERKAGGDPRVGLRHERERRKTAERELAELRQRLADGMPADQTEQQKPNVLEGKDEDEFVDISTVQQLLAEQRQELLASFSGNQQRQAKAEALVATIQQYDVFGRNDEAGDLAREAVTHALLAAPHGADYEEIIATHAKRAEKAFLAVSSGDPTKSPQRPAPTPDPTPAAAEAATMRTPATHPKGVTMAELNKAAAQRIQQIRDKAQEKVRAAALD